MRWHKCPRVRHTGLSHDALLLQAITQHWFYAQPPVKVLDSQPETQNESCRLELALVETLPMPEHGGGLQR